MNGDQVDEHQGAAGQQRSYLSAAAARRTSSRRPRQRRAQLVAAEEGRRRTWQHILTSPHSSDRQRQRAREILGLELESRDAGEGPIGEIRPTSPAPVPDLDTERAAVAVVRLLLGAEVISVAPVRPRPRF